MKKIVTTLLLLLIALPISAQAHTALTASTPSEGETVKEKLEEVELSFGTAIEQGSLMAIKGEAATYELKGVTVSENTMTGSVAEELPNGDYFIQWKIIGADGHPIEGEVPFEINIAADEPVMEEEGTADEEPAVDEEGTANEEPAVEEVQTETPEASQSAGTGGEASNNTLVTVLVAGAALLVGAGMFGLLKKKR